MRYAEVYLHRHMVPDGGLAGHTAVVFDVLRASTSVCAALKAGAQCVVPFADLEEMAAFRAGLPGDLRDQCLMAGERGGVAAPGFDIGNSPADFTPEKVGGKIVAFSTTNGTDALTRACEAAPVYFGTLVNIGALSGEIDGLRRRENEELALVCSGSELSASLEDMLAAGLLLERLGADSNQWELDDGALAVLAVAAKWKGREREAMELAVGGRSVAALGLDADIDYAAQVDSTDIVPKLVADSEMFKGVDVLVNAGDEQK